MDRDRLKEVQQTDLSESRMNEDFVQLLRRHGLTVLLAVLILLCLIVGYDRLKDFRIRKADNAQFELSSATTPIELQRIARDYPTVAPAALLRAADIFLQSVQSNLALMRITNAAEAPPQLTEEDRISAIREGERLYNELLTLVEKNPGERLFAVSATNGLAALAESKGDFDAARRYYDRTIAFAEDRYPQQALLAKSRKESLGALPAEVRMLSESQLKRPSIIDPLFQELIVLPPDTNERSGGAPE